ncbi:MAG: ligase-associated DNA damage response DEXH box helicase [Chthoniobacterales bacterium]
MACSVDDWFSRRGWEVFPFQREVWEAYGRGESGLVHCSTGAGKTYAVWFAALQAEAAGAGTLRVLWVTPLRALAADTEGALRAPVEEMDLDWTVGRRTGDTSSHVRKKQMERPPNALVTTPESLCVLLSQKAFAPQFASVELIVVDEWHELISSKRGVLTELALARVRALAPRARTWGLSATLGNTAEAARVLGGSDAKTGVENPMRVVRGAHPKQVVIETVLPPEGQRFAWAGHLGLQLLPEVVKRLRESRTTIVFTNTRSQAELWYQALVGAMSDWKGQLGLHHGSLSNEVRVAAEEGLRTGELRAVVATSSLDLGVDFAPVECVIQVGSPKGVARLLQRAGRSGHQPGAVSRVVCVPANTFELVEIAAARDLAATLTVEARTPLRAPLDVLCQHLVTVVSAGPIQIEALKREVRSTHAYRDLSEAEWDWVLDFAARGGAALQAYPEYARMTEDGGLLVLKDESMARLHRLGIGTISGEATVEVRFANGARLGAVEEGFLAKLRPGDRFLFAGRSLELVRVRDLRATVRAGGRRTTGVPRWVGGRMPLSSQLATGVRARLQRWSEGGGGESAEIRRLEPVLEIQARLSRVPGVGDLLIEKLKSREGWHLFFYPFEGRLAHEGLAALFAYRFARDRPLTFSLAVNDYGFELLSAEEAPLEEALGGGLLSADGLTDDILGSVHSTEMARRRFREIARIAGLVREGLGRARKSARAMTISSSLLFDVFRQYDAENLLLGQATSEVLESELEYSRMIGALERMRGMQRVVVRVPSATPFAYPLFVARLRQQLSTEALADRVRRMEKVMERES